MLDVPDDQLVEVPGMTPAFAAPELLFGEAQAMGLRHQAYTAGMQGLLLSVGPYMFDSFVKPRGDEQLPSIWPEDPAECMQVFEIMRWAMENGGYSQQFVQLVLGLVHPDFQQRLGIGEALQHPYWASHGIDLNNVSGPHPLLAQFVERVMRSNR